MSEFACPVCGGYVTLRKDGTILPHGRYVDGGGYDPGLDHTIVPCEGGTDE